MSFRQHILNAIYALERNIMEQLAHLQASVDKLTTQSNALISLTNTLATDLTALKTQVTDPTVAAGLDAAIAKIDAANAAMAAAVTTDSAAEGAVNPTTTTVESTVAGVTGATDSNPGATTAPDAPDAPNVGTTAG